MKKANAIMKKILIMLLLLVSTMSFCSCNNDSYIGDTVYITMNDGTQISGKIVGYKESGTVVEVDCGVAVFFVPKRDVIHITESGIYGEEIY